MASTASSFRTQKLQQQKVSPVPRRSATMRKPDRRLSLSFLYFSTAASLITSITYLFYRLAFAIRGDHVSFTMWTVLLIEILTSSKAT